MTRNGERESRRDATGAQLAGATAVQYGVGPIGGRIVRTAVSHGVEFVGGVDIDPSKVGEDLGRVAGCDTDLGVEVTDDAHAALAADPDVVFHATGSSLPAVEPQLEECLRAGANVVSTTEALAFPWTERPDLAADLDRTAKAADRTLLGTGINPGFAMDFLPVVLAVPCREIERIEVTRVQDAATRREPLQEKIGAGTSLETFEREIATGAGHVGLPESVAMIAAAVGWDLTAVEETIEPVVVEEAVESEFVRVEPGDVAGIRQVGTGVVDGRSVIELDLQLSLGAADPRDHVSITGTPDWT